MTTSTDFESQLDDNPADWTLRAIYADWLEEQEHANSRVTLGTYAHAIPQRQAEAVAKIERMYG